MKQGIFRKVSLDRLSSPEQLDQLMTVTTPRAWFVLLAIGAILITAVSWGIFGSIPTKTHGQGILIKSGGIYNIAHIQSGQITDIRFEEGDIVKKGDVVARIDQQELVKQINDYKMELKQFESLGDENFDLDMENMSAGLNELYQLDRSLKEAKADLKIKEADYIRIKNGSNDDELKNAKFQLEQAQIKEETDKRDFVDKNKLYKNGAISKKELTQAKEQLDVAKLDLKRLTELVKQYKSEEYRSTYKAQVDQAELRVQLLEEQLVVTKKIKITEAREKIKELQKQLELSANIVAQVDGRVLEVKVKKGDIISAGKELLSLVREGDIIKDLEVVMYVAPEEGKRILPGMEAQISPTIVKKEEHGYMLGRVVSVSEYPATSQGMMRTLGNQDLVAKLSGQSAPIEIRIDLIRDESTMTGYKWSTPQGPPLIINSGTLCAGSVTVSKQRPIRMVIPLIKKYLPIE